MADFLCQMSQSSVRPASACLSDGLILVLLNRKIYTPRRDVKKLLCSNMSSLCKKRQVTQITANRELKIDRPIREEGPLQYERNSSHRDSTLKTSN